MHPNAQLIETFYRAFQRRDAEAMAACYATDVVFEDPAFGELRGADAGDMWRMLCARAKDLDVRFSAVQADDTAGRAHWEADYLFARTGRPVHNRIDATFRFRDGLIVEHRDRFDLWAWSRQALGLPGLLLGWSPLVRNTVRAQARSGLTQFQSKR
ncbi:nuclear transport factor 2 family protein [Chiayiivirga flava]|uniref:Ketosteroid isomerase-like protein n=1 Tax=Chiayiivirga flava TaxID=659595 RepID=A0A7W8D321_9GAMM|nr:nuclear transport factor 2 family protein [Chiayiivirga flava]MBB5206989.1 ketosteroid isomerase-like protein [Chiayiivirga flava]